MSLMKICVKNIPIAKYEMDIVELFEQFGEVKEVKILDKPNRYNERVGFVEMAGSGGERAIEALNEHNYDGYSLKAHRVAKILTIDDDIDIWALIDLILQRFGYQHIFATKAHQTLDLLQDAQPDLLILDLLLPDIDPWELYDLIKSKPEFKGIGVILLTSRRYVVDELRVADLLDKRDSFLQKPIDIAKFLETIENVLDGYGKSSLVIRDSNYLRILPQPKAG